MPQDFNCENTYNTAIVVTAIMLNCLSTTTSTHAHMHTHTHSHVHRCGSGLQGLKDQGYTNSAVCRLIQNYEDIFEVHVCRQLYRSCVEQPDTTIA